MHIMIETLIKSADKDILLAKFCDQEILHTIIDETATEGYQSLNRTKGQSRTVTIELEGEDQKDERASGASSHGIGVLKTANTIQVGNE